MLAPGCRCRRDIRDRDRVLLGDIQSLYRKAGTTSGRFFLLLSVSYTRRAANIPLIGKRIVPYLEKKAIDRNPRCDSAVRPRHIACCNSAPRLRGVTCIVTARGPTAARAGAYRPAHGCDSTVRSARRYPRRDERRVRRAFARRDACTTERRVRASRSNAAIARRDHRRHLRRDRAARPNAAYRRNRRRYRAACCAVHRTAFARCNSNTGARCKSNTAFARCNERRVRRCKPNAVHRALHRRRHRAPPSSGAFTRRNPTVEAARAEPLPTICCYKYIILHRRIQYIEHTRYTATAPAVNTFARDLRANPPYERLYIL